MSRTPHPTRTLNVKRAAILFVGLGLAAGAVYGANRSMVRRNADAMLRQAKKAEAEGNTQEAARLYVDYLNFQPKDADALAGYAGLLEATGQKRPRSVRQRAEVYERLLRVDPARKEERRKLVRLYLDMPFYGAAKDHLDVLLDPARGGDPDDPDLLTQYAVCELGAHRPAEAAERLRQAIDTKRAASETYITLVYVLRNELKTPEARDEADQVLARLTKDKPDDPTARLARARYLISIKKYDEARKELEAAIGGVKSREVNPDVALLLAELNLAENKPTEARDVLEKAVAANPTDARLRLVLSDVYARLNEPKKAKSELSAATPLLREEGVALLDAIDRKIDYGMLAEAKQDAQRFESKEDYQPAANYLMGRLLLAEGNWPAALARLEQAVGPFERLPRYLAKARLAMAAGYRAANNPDQMLAAAAAAVRADPLNPAARLAHAEASALVGRWADALPVYKQYADRSPEARVAYARYALAEQLAKPPAARNWAAFDQAAGSPPYPVEVVLLKARALAAAGDRAKAVELVREAKKQKPGEPDVRVALAGLVGQKDPAAGLAELDEAEKQIGDRAAFRLAKAQLLAADPAGAGYPAVAALGENTAAFRPQERFVLFAGLGDIVAGKLGKRAEAAEWYRRAAAEDPYNLLARAALFLNAQAANRPDLAEQALKEIRDLDTPDGPTYQVLDAQRQLPALRAGGRDKLPAVRAQVEKAVAKRPSWPHAHALLGELDDLAEDADGALDHYRKAFDLGERSDALVRRMVGLLFQRSRYEEAKRVLEAREQAGNLPADLRRQQALVDSALGDPARTAAAAKAAENSRDPAEHLFRGQSLMLAGDWRGAAAAFQKVVDLDPGHVTAWINLVRVHAQAGDRETAKAIADRAEKELPAVAKLPGKAAVPTAVGYMRVHVGQYREAEAAYKQALAAAPADPDATRRLVELYLQTGRPADAVPPLEALLASPARDGAKRWARRALAQATADRPGGFARIDEAVALVDENLKAGARVEDERAKAFLLAADPFRRAEAKQMILASTRQGPLTPEEAAAFARLLVDEGDLANAESLLREATRSAVARPEHLRLLHRVQLTRGRPKDARQTLDKLKAVEPAAWETAAEEARHLARTGDKAAAAKVVLDAPAAKDPAFQLDAAAPLLTEIGCTDEAEKLLTKLVESTALPNRHHALARFYVAAGKPEKAVELTKRLDPKEYGPAAKAQVFTAAAAVRPVSALPPADRPAWEAALAEVAGWVAEQLTARPKDPELHQCAAVVADARGRYDEAITAYERMLEANPESVAANNNLAHLLAVHRKDGSNRPLELAEAAIRRAGPRPALLDTRAVVHLAADRPAEAIRDLEAAVRLDQNPKYYFHLALAFEKAGNAARKIAAIDAIGNRLKKPMLHAREWADYERLFGPG